jgi:hypothetical protein
MDRPSSLPRLISVRTAREGQRLYFGNGFQNRQRSGGSKTSTGKFAVFANAVMGAHGVSLYGKGIVIGKVL